jgi:hypothetical protein
MPELEVRGGEQDRRVKGCKIDRGEEQRHDQGVVEGVRGSRKVVVVIQVVVELM